MTREIEKLGQIANRSVGVTGIWKTGVGVPQFIEEWVAHSLDRRKTVSRSILKEGRDQIDRFRRSLAEDLSTSS